MKSIVDYNMLLAPGMNLSRVCCPGKLYLIYLFWEFYLKK
jgi:hypothetical protein